MSAWLCLLGGLVWTGIGWAAEEASASEASASEASASEASASEASATEDPATGEPAHDDGATDTLPPDRTEWGVLPAFSFSPDNGMSLGAVWTLVRFQGARKPHHWRLYGLQRGNLDWQTGTPQLGAYRLNQRFDVPSVAGSPVRLIVTVDAFRERNVRYCGFGNTSTCEGPEGAIPEYDLYRRTIAFANVYARTRLHDRPDAPTGREWIELVVGLEGRFSRTDPYADSRLAQDIAAAEQADDLDPTLQAALLDGTRDHGLLYGVVGLALDRRDSEWVPLRGEVLGLSVSGGLSHDATLRFGQIKWDNRVYRAIAGDRLSFAGRWQLDLNFGRVPLYVLDGVYDGFSIRGIRSRNYVGRTKLVQNLELRSRWFDFKLVGQRFNLGGVAFVDAGRVWSGVKDGGSLVSDNGAWNMVHAGAGGGLRLQWASTFVIRADYARAVTQDQSGFYLAVGHAI